MKLGDIEDDEFGELLKGKTLMRIEGAEPGSENVKFTLSGGLEIDLEHYQDCCESVYLAEVVGDIADLIGEPLHEVEVVMQNGDDSEECGDSCTWTFYKFGTRKGRVTLRWLGESNGYYSEGVDARVCKLPEVQ